MLFSHYGFSSVYLNIYQNERIKAENKAFRNAKAKLFGQTTSVDIYVLSLNATQWSSVKGYNETKRKHCSDYLKWYALFVV